MTRRGADFIAGGAARTASVLGPRGMRIIAQLNRFVTNPILRPWAPRLRHMAVIEHRGRSSGKSYQTPVMAFVANRSLSVVLNYGRQSDWVRNVMAAGSAVVLHRGQRYALSTPRVVPIDSAELPANVRAIGVSERHVLYAALSPA